MNKWSIYTWTIPVFSYKPERTTNTSLVCPKKLFIEAMEERFNKYPKDSEIPLEFWAEPGRFEKQLGVKPQKSEKYYGKEAQGWEVQALTRARFLGGSEKVGQQFWPAVEKSWLRWGKEKGFFKEIVAMRERIATERVAQGAEERSYKTARGGLLDVEFAAQAWQMREGFRESRTGLVLQTMSKTLPREAGVLTDGLNFWSRVGWWEPFRRGIFLRIRKRIS